MTESESVALPFGDSAIFIPTFCQHMLYYIIFFNNASAFFFFAPECASEPTDWALCAQVFFHCYIHVIIYLLKRKSKKNRKNTVGFNLKKFDRKD